MGFLKRIRKSLKKARSKRGKEKEPPVLLSKQELATQTIKPAQPPKSTKPEYVVESTNTAPMNSDQSEIEIDVDNFQMPPEAEFDVDEEDFHSTSFPTSIAFGADDMSIISSPSFRRVMSRDHHQNNEPQHEQSFTNVLGLVDNNLKTYGDNSSTCSFVIAQTGDGDRKEGQGNTAIEVILPEDDSEKRKSNEEPTLQRRRDGIEANEILESLETMQKPTRNPTPYHPSPHYNNQIDHSYIPRFGHSPTKQRNQLLKYQHQPSKASQFKQQIQGYFRYVPRNTEDNSVSIVSC